MDIDLRLVRYFTVVAEHGNFHRAAAALRTAQPSLSRQIQQLEKVLGVRLFERTRQGSHLTAAGQAFLPEALALLTAAERAVDRARSANGSPTLLIGHTGNLIVTPVVRELRRRGISARTRHLTQPDVAAALLDRRVDVVLARTPLPAGRLRVTVLYDEPKVLVVPVTHRLAGKESVSLADFADEPLVRYPDPALDAYWRIDPRPDGRPAPDGPVAATMEDKLELVAAGDALTMAPLGGDDTALRRDLTWVRVHDVEPCRVLVAARPGETGPLVEEFTRVAAALLGGVRER
ncbi:LysR family transcriptional regulator [Actinoplanes sp. L3-i22]|uniref:LysR family transcriptional regulator n=1 Tax=Actinoplanes sp. L3-i22 TaxID=2836373 RepID=UPI001C779BA6|nr:LysR family transcriptional regulator [Actinoplanes sp. L3-i22]BCY09540.1 LysR family transcriptional regulator [Actinoplanes sp. L3-i22]